MAKFGIGEGNKQEIAKDIFGWTIGDSVVKGLVESNSQVEFENNVEELMQKWWHSEIQKPNSVNISDFISYDTHAIAWQQNHV